ncbi:hypothetical protein JCM21900_002681 [Sporobolomyces salmonicolor]
MDAEVHGRLIAAAASLLNGPALGQAIAHLPTSSSPKFDPLVLPPSNHTLQDDLLHLGCTAYTVEALLSTYEVAEARLAEHTRWTFNNALAQLAAVVNAEDKDVLERVDDALRQRFAREYLSASDECRRDVLAEVAAAKARYSASATAATSNDDSPRGIFTEEVLDILNAAFEAGDTVTRAEVQQLTAVTGLRARQVRTWFANQRQRRHKRASPYGQPRYTSALSATRKATAPRRNISNASSSSLISYAESSSSDVPQWTSARDDSPQPSLDLDVEPTAPNSASFEAFAQRFHIAPPQNQDQEIDVPMMQSTEPTPVVPQFQLDLSSTSADSLDRPLPSPAITSAVNPSFFSQTFSQPISSSSSSFSPFGSSPSSSPSQAPTFFQPAFSSAQAASLPLFEQLQHSDPFLDDTFLENVFGNLGVQRGLTLSMEAMREEGSGAEQRGMGGEMPFVW